MKIIVLLFVMFQATVSFAADAPLAPNVVKMLVEDCVTNENKTYFECELDIIDAWSKDSFTKSQLEIINIKSRR